MTATKTHSSNTISSNMAFSHSGIALIVGGSSGMGFESAKQLVKSNIQVVIVGNNAAKLEKAVAELSEFGKVSGLQADLIKKAMFNASSTLLNYLQTRLVIWSMPPATSTQSPSLSTARVIMKFIWA